MLSFLRRTFSIKLIFISRISLLLFYFSPIIAIEYKSSWLGNSFSGANDKWVQNYVTMMTVQPDGTVWTSSHWDEAGRRYGIYKDGDVIGNKNNNINSHQVGGWKINGQCCSERYNFLMQGTSISKDGVTITDCGKVSAIAMSADGYLMAADNGPRRQILFYDVKQNPPKIVKTFGDYGGISSGIPGVLTPTKLWSMSGIGTDAQNNIYVAINENSLILRKLTPSGELVWELMNTFFVDNVDCDASTDCRDVYGVNEHFKMDWSKSKPGSEWKLYAHTCDCIRYPNDPRCMEAIKAHFEHGLTNAWIRTVNGRRILFTSGMTCNFLHVFVFNEGEEIARPAALFKNPWRIYVPPGHPEITYWPPYGPDPFLKEKPLYIWLDRNGDGDYQADEWTNTGLPYSGNYWIDKDANIYYGSSPIRKFIMQGFDKYGTPIYSAKAIEEIPSPSAAHMVYLPEKDIMVMQQGGSCRETSGSKFHVYHNWSKGNRQSSVSFSPGSPHGSAWSAAGNYVFDVGWESRAECFIHSLDGKFIGSMVPSEEVGGLRRTGWVDIGYGCNAYQRKTGEYIVFVEDDYYGKVVIYRWAPEGLKPEEPVESIGEEDFRNHKSIRIPRSAIVIEPNRNTVRLKMFSVSGTMLGSWSVPDNPATAFGGRNTSTGIKILKIEQHNAITTVPLFIDN